MGTLTQLRKTYNQQHPIMNPHSTPIATLTATPAPRAARLLAPAISPFIVMTPFAGHQSKAMNGEFGLLPVAKKMNLSALNTALEGDEPEKKALREQIDELKRLNTSPKDKLQIKILNALCKSGVSLFARKVGTADEAEYLLVIKSKDSEKSVEDSRLKNMTVAPVSREELEKHQFTKEEIDEILGVSSTIANASVATASWFFGLFAWLSSQIKGSDLFQRLFHWMAVLTLKSTIESAKDTCAAAKETCVNTIPETCAFVETAKNATVRVMDETKRQALQVVDRVSQEKENIQRFAGDALRDGIDVATSPQMRLMIASAKSATILSTKAILSATGAATKGSFKAAMHCLAKP